MHSRSRLLPTAAQRFVERNQRDRSVPVTGRQFVYCALGAMNGGTVNPCSELRACFKNTRGSAARDFGRSRGSTTSCAALVCSDCEARESPQRALSAEPTTAAAKRTAARRVFAQKALWLRCSSVTAPLGGCSVVAPRHRDFCAKTEPLVFLRHALNDRKKG